jgi:hypothetical protein
VTHGHGFPQRGRGRRRGAVRARDEPVRPGVEVPRKPGPEVAPRPIAALAPHPPRRPVAPLRRPPDARRGEGHSGEPEEE